MLLPLFYCQFSKVKNVFISVDSNEFPLSNYTLYVAKLLQGDNLAIDHSGDSQG